MAVNSGGIEFTVDTSELRTEWKAAIRNYERWRDDLDEKLDEVVEEYAEEVFKTAKEEVPVDTGNLRSTIEIILKDAKDSFLKAFVGTQKTTYAAYQEFGTSIMDAQPYLRPALKKHAQDFVKAISQTVTRHAAQASQYK
jgi:HK97 gp10 family phage protein